jgi:ubiquitin-protein ligase
MLLLRVHHVVAASCHLLLLKAVLAVLLVVPCTEHSLQPELAALYDRDREAFNHNAREYTKAHAM